MASNSKKISVEDVVVSGVLSVLNRKDSAIWVGTMTDLGNQLEKVLTREQAAFLPKSPSALRIVLNRVISRLRNRKMSIRFGRTPDHMRTRFVRFVTR